LSLFHSFSGVKIFYKNNQDKLKTQVNMSNRAAQGRQILQSLLDAIVSKKLPIADISYSLGIFSLYFETDIDSSNKGWSFFICMTGWRLQHQEKVILGCDDQKKEEEIRSSLSIIQNRKLLTYSILNVWFDLFLSFEENLYLRTFSVLAKPGRSNSCWTLFTPDHRSFSIDYGGTWRFEKTS